MFSYKSIIFVKIQFHLTPESKRLISFFGFSLSFSIFFSRDSGCVFPPCTPSESDILLYLFCNNMFSGNQALGLLEWLPGATRAPLCDLKQCRMASVQYHIICFKLTVHWQKKPILGMCFFLSLADSKHPQRSREGFIALVFISLDFLSLCSLFWLIWKKKISLWSLSSSQLFSCLIAKCPIIAKDVQILKWCLQILCLLLESIPKPRSYADTS